MQLRWRKPAPQEIDHELVWLTVSLGMGAGLVVWLAARLPTPHCIFHSLTGFPCITCGATRSAIQFFHGHLGASLLLNPLAFVSYCGIAFFDLYALGVLLTRGRRFRLIEFTPKEQRILRLAAVLLLFANWVYLIVAGRV